MNKNIAVIGCGYWGKNLVRNFHQLNSLHTIFDIDETKLESFRIKYPGLNVCTDYKSLLLNLGKFRTEENMHLLEQVL